MELNPRSPQLYSSPRNFVHVVRQLMDPDNCRRDNARLSKRLSLKIQPVDDNFFVDGEPIWAISSDISRRGMGFIIDDPMAHEYLRITLENEKVSVIAALRHCTSIGTTHPLYLIGVEFLDEYLA